MTLNIQNHIHTQTHTVTPKITNLVSIREQLCVNTTWDAITTGSCEKVTYDIDYYLDVDAHNKTNVTTATFSGTSTKHECFESYPDVVAVLSITLRATYRTFKSNVTRLTVTHITTTTTTTTTTETPVKPPRNKTITGLFSTDNWSLNFLYP